MGWWPAEEKEGELEPRLLTFLLSQQQQQQHLLLLLLLPLLLLLLSLLSQPAVAALALRRLEWRPWPPEHA